MFKSLLGAILILCSGFASASPEQCKIFNDSQIKVMKYAYSKGKPHDFGWTLAAISWQESSAGLVLKHPKADSYGLFGGLLRTVESRLKDEEFARTLPKIPKTRKQTVFLIQHDWEFASEFALAELNYWKERREGNKVLASYFGGYKSNTPAARNYAKTINDKIRFLKREKCI
ncbi:MAG: hypothetical protein [Caudoviricetes sp.]|nr:MAG: hypothetical protein [Caudoviricetes sp.]